MGEVDENNRKKLVLADIMKVKELMDNMPIPKEGRLMSGYLPIKHVLKAKRFPRKVKKGLKEGIIILNFSEIRNRLQKIKSPN